MLSGGQRKVGGERMMGERRVYGGPCSLFIKAVLFALLITAFGLNKSWGDVIDQRWEEPVSSHDRSSWSIKNNAPIGQEYNAGMNNITAVELSITDFGDPPSGIATIDVKIRDDTIQGDILASGSATFETVPDEWVYVDFGGVLPLTAGNRYVIEVSMPSGSEYWSWNSWDDADGIGLPGRQIIQGNIYTSENMAFGFRTYAVPEPATLLLLGLGGFVLLRKKRS
jgi:hypothetical protein